MPDRGTSFYYRVSLDSDNLLLVKIVMLVSGHAGQQKAHDDIFEKDLCDECKNLQSCQMLAHTTDRLFAIGLPEMHVQKESESNAKRVGS